MKLFRRSLYLLYYFKESDFKLLLRYARYASEASGKSMAGIMADSIGSVYSYNISLKDYFYFRFFEIGKEERSKWAGTGFMYEYQLVMNPKEMRNILENKIKFLHGFQPFVHRKFLDIKQLKNDSDEVKNLLENSSGRIVVKGSKGQVGAEVEVIRCGQYDRPALIHYMESKKYDLVEEYVVQHPSLMELSPSGLNTLRIFTQLYQGEVKYLGARLRVSVNSPVDNMAAGNLAAPVDLDSGVVVGPGVYSDITKSDREVHPLTGVAITGFTVPFWEQTMELVRKAAINTPENKSVGWDIAITGEGPELIEGNHNWCKLLWQLPVKKGLKAELEKYL